MSSSASAQSSPSSTNQASATTEGKVPELEQKRLYVRWRVTDDGLKAAFAKFGNITEARVIRGPRIHQYGFVTFDTHDDASGALKTMTGMKLTSDPMVIEYASASPKRPRGKRAGQTGRTRRPPKEKSATVDAAPTTPSSPPASTSSSSSTPTPGSPSKSAPKSSPKSGGAPKASPKTKTS